eukprot:82745-Prorocentrum_minimum.AAC.1
MWWPTKQVEQDDEEEEEEEKYLAQEEEEEEYQEEEAGDEDNTAGEGEGQGSDDEGGGYTNVRKRASAARQQINDIVKAHTQDSVRNAREEGDDEPLDEDSYDAETIGPDSEGDCEEEI